MALRKMKVSLGVHERCHCSLKKEGDTELLKFSISNYFLPAFGTEKVRICYLIESRDLAQRKLDFFFKIHNHNFDP